MTEQTLDMESLMEDISAVLEAVQNGNLDAVYDYRASIISMYAQAMVEFHFQEQHLEWLNDLLRTVEDNNIVSCLQVLEEADNTDDIFLGAQFAAMMAGFFHHDELMTAVQASGLKALLEAIASQNESGEAN